MLEKRWRWESVRWAFTVKKADVKASNLGMIEATHKAKWSLQGLATQPRHEPNPQDKRHCASKSTGTGKPKDKLAILRNITSENLEAKMGQNKGKQPLKGFADLKRPDFKSKKLRMQASLPAEKKDILHE